MLKLHTNALPCFRKRLDTEMFSVELLDDQGVDIRLKTTSTEANDQDAYNQGGERVPWLGDYRGDGREDEDYMANDVDTKRDRDGLEAAPVLICNIGPKQGHQVLPELVEGGNSCRSSLVHSQGTRLSIWTWAASARIGSLRQGLLDKICVL